jgi:hypothetical protein
MVIVVLLVVGSNLVVAGPVLSLSWPYSRVASTSALTLAFGLLVLFFWGLAFGLLVLFFGALCSTLGPYVCCLLVLLLALFCLVVSIGRLLLVVCRFVSGRQLLVTDLLGCVNMLVLFLVCLRRKRSLLAAHRLHAQCRESIGNVDGLPLAAGRNALP